MVSLVGEEEVTGREHKAAVGRASGGDGNILFLDPCIHYISGSFAPMVCVLFF